MKKGNIIEPRERIPRKVKCGAIGIDELEMIKEVLKKERFSKRNGKKKGEFCENSKLKINVQTKSMENGNSEMSSQRLKDISSIKQCKVKEEYGTNEDFSNSRLKKFGLSHFMELEERKDLLMSNRDDDPLCINGPEAYDAVGWAPVKQEVPDDIEVSCVTITEVPLKPVEELQITSLPSSPSSPAAPLPTKDSCKSESLTIADCEKIDKIKSVNNDDDDLWWNSDCNNGGSDRDSDDGSIVIPLKSSVKRKSEPHSCNMCGKKLSSKSSLRLHKKKKHNIKFNCELCSSNFDLQRDLIKHRNTVHRGKDGRFTCKECAKYFSNYRSFLVHLKTHYEAREVFSDFNDDFKDWFKCNECYKRFNREEGLHLHIAMNHNSDVGYGEKLKQPEKNFICHTCGKTFTFGCLLRDHTNLHTGAKPYLCQSCGRSFAQKASLKQHSRTHNSVRPFQCSVCTQGFFEKGDLKKHMRKHTGERPYVCEICGDGFSQSSHLGAHRRSHTGERPFKCDICSRGFTKKGDVVRHRRIHTGELPYLCQVCGKAFRQSTQCTNHIKNHHPDALTTSKNEVILS